MVQTVYRWFTNRPLRLIGGFLVFISVGLLIFLTLLDIIAGLHNPYLGIIAYMILPAVLILGLILVPLDAWLHRRQVARGEPEYPVIDLCDPRLRKIAMFFTLASVVILVVMTVVTYKSVEYMDTATFCGEVCHKVMRPELTAFRRSAHASVACVECHIGPGAPWFVRAKLSGVPQVWHYMLKDYPRPLPTPVKALRPSRDTCENCHWPQWFYGSKLRTSITYEQDKSNTRQTSTMIMHVGSGGVRGSGIHSHIVSKIHYLPAVENRSEIAWVRVERPDGSTQEFVNPSYQSDLGKLRKRHQTRFMDCIDCHNRAAHHFDTFESLLDDSMTRGTVSTSLPFIKREAMNAVGETEKVPTQAQQARVMERIGRIASFYKNNYPQVYRTREATIRRSVEEIQRDYQGTFFPHMKIGPDTYPDWKSHDGCFRCHGTMVAASSKGRDKEIPADCNLCHSEQISGTPQETVAAQ